MDVCTRASGGKGGGGVWEMVGFGARPSFRCSDAPCTSLFSLEIMICMQECAPGRPLSMILENGHHDRKRVVWLWFVRGPPGLRPSNTTTQKTFIQILWFANKTLALALNSNKLNSSTTVN